MASPEVEQLAAKIQHGLAADPEAAIPALAESARAAKAVLADWPQLGVIKACYEAGPGGCEFCNEYGFEHVTEAEEVPEWVTAAEAEQAAARTVMDAIKLALSAEWTAPGQAVAVPRPCE